MTTRTSAQTIDEYTAAFPPETQRLLDQVRAVIAAAAPDATERISYAIPTFHLDGNLVHYAGYPFHIGFYPGAAGIAEFKNELGGFKNAKGSVQFPLDQPLPVDLIRRIVEFRAAQNRARGARRRSKGG